MWGDMVIKEFHDIQILNQIKYTPAGALMGAGVTLKHINSRVNCFQVMG